MVNAVGGCETYNCNFFVQKGSAKTSKKLDIHTKNVEKAKKKDRYRIYAELITANLYKLTKNSNEAVLENYYDNNKLKANKMYNNQVTTGSIFSRPTGFIRLWCKKRN